MRAPATTPRRTGYRYIGTAHTDLDSSASKVPLSIRSLLCPGATIFLDACALPRYDPRSPPARPRVGGVRLSRYLGCATGESRTEEAAHPTGGLFRSGVAVQTGMGGDREIASETARRRTTRARRPDPDPDPIHAGALHRTGRDPPRTRRRDPDLEQALSNWDEWIARRQGSGR